MAMSGQYVNMFNVSLEVLDAGAHINHISFLHIVTTMTTTTTITTTTTTPATTTMTEHDR
jgi:hypothetical protein